jgi:peptidoglycan/xylan/chitin deacetylase (PgdA/CDA1 family)
MLNYRNVNIFFILFILLWVGLDYRYRFSPAAYGWILLIYVSILFCGSYFIRLGFFFRSVCSGDPGKKEIVLSFDDGPDPLRTPAILDLLEEKNVQAIFFCIGKKIPGNEQVLQRLTGAGHLIGNHSYSHHPLFDLYSPQRMQEELEDTNRTIQAVTGLRPRLFRPPYGVTNPNLKKAVENLGLISVGWNVRSLDTVIRDEQRLLRRVLRKIRPGSILLFHDSSEATVRILDTLISRIREMGYEIVRPDKMLKLEPYA